MRELRELSTKTELKQRRELLIVNNLKEVSSDYCLGLYDKENLLATGAVKDNVIQTVAVKPELQGMGLINIIISELYTYLRELNYKDVFVFSSSNNEKTFNSLGFTTVAKTEKWIFLESDKHGFENWLESQKVLAKKTNSCIVMNANPFTLGHHYLVEQALQHKEHLIIFVVQQDSSFFDFKTRLELVKLGLSDLDQTSFTIIPSSSYLISQATFPTYFTKDKTEGDLACSELDAHLFSTRIAPILNIKIRYVGTEPNDITTAVYNEQLKKQQIELRIIERYKIKDITVSASLVRKYYEKNQFYKLKNLLPDKNYKYLVSLKLAKLAKESLIKEVEVTPTPGLVDKNNNGSHKDMDLPLFIKSAEAIEPYFFKIALQVFKDPIEDFINVAEREIGKNAEKEMLKVTNGVNTHKGAIFSFSLFIISIVQLLKQGKIISPEAISNRIKILSNGLNKEFNNSYTKGEKAYSLYKSKGIRGEAINGYINVLNAYYLKEDNLCFTLLYLISQVEDTNIIMRSDLATANWSKIESKRVYESHNLLEIKKLDQSFIDKNISPGGSADLLALTIFLKALMCN